jgi:hypothetical protein
MIGVASYVAFRISHWQAERTKSKPHTPVIESHSTDLIIRDLLTECRVILGASRVYLHKFSNGDKYIDGSDVIKTSRTHESVDQGVSYEASRFQNMLISTIPDAMEMVIEEGPSFRAVDDLPEGKFKWLCMNCNVIGVARCAIRKGDSLVGYIGADFQHAQKPEAIERLCEFGGRINSVLEEASKGREIGYGHRKPGQYYRWLLWRIIECHPFWWTARQMELAHES